jgi:hypothetical protein
MSKLQVKIDGKDFGLWNCCDERTYAKEPIRNAGIDKLRKTSPKKTKINFQKRLDKSAKVC